jgi:(2Fe-2S) ferredoxin
MVYSHNLVQAFSHCMANSHYKPINTVRNTRTTWYTFVLPTWYARHTRAAWYKLVLRRVLRNLVLPRSPPTDKANKNTVKMLPTIAVPNCYDALYLITCHLKPSHFTHHICAFLPSPPQRKFLAYHNNTTTSPFATWHLLVAHLTLAGPV